MGGGGPLDVDAGPAAGARVADFGGGSRHFGVGHRSRSVVVRGPVSGGVPARDFTADEGALRGHLELWRRCNVTVAGCRWTRLMTPQNGVCRAASTARKTACPVPWATETSEPPSGTRISGFPTELKGRADYMMRRMRRTRTTKRTQRQHDERRTTTAEGTGTAWFPRKQPTSGEPKGTVTHAQTVTPQEGRG
ncbi:hypothetical protein NDU88_001177 [Pleurodeles waltl]|uniref:Uncharacterized protein n=1 Tax=Pleurodeles waltl TaxID=8319 RepID=A0AAV7TJC9_PLEWA|nr:hypothetical protein NDU88_001177 [Pleurodeles waltl]